MYTYSVKCNEAGNELATEEVLYTGLTRAVASATARSCSDMADDDSLNFYIAKEAEVKIFRVEDATGAIVFSSDDVREAADVTNTKNRELTGVGYEPTFRLLVGEGEATYVLKPANY